MCTVHIQRVHAHVCAGKIDFLAKAQPSKVSQAAIVGAGTMGGGIAMCFAEVCTRMYASMGGIAMCFAEVHAHMAWLGMRAYVHTRARGHMYACACACACACTCAQAGMDVTIVDRSEEALANGLRIVRGNWEVSKRVGG